MDNIPGEDQNLSTMEQFENHLESAKLADSSDNASDLGEMPFASEVSHELDEEVRGEEKKANKASRGRTQSQRDNHNITARRSREKESEAYNRLSKKVNGRSGGTHYQTYCRANTRIDELEDDVKHLQQVIQEIRTDFAIFRASQNNNGNSLSQEKEPSPLNSRLHGFLPPPPNDNIGGFSNTQQAGPAGDIHPFRQDEFEKSPFGSGNHLNHQDPPAIAPGRQFNIFGQNSQETPLHNGNPSKQLEQLDLRFHWPPGNQWYQNDRLPSPPDDQFGQHILSQPNQSVQGSQEIQGQPYNPQSEAEGDGQYNQPPQYVTPFQQQGGQDIEGQFGQAQFVQEQYSQAFQYPFSIVQSVQGSQSGQQMFGVGPSNL